MKINQVSLVILPLFLLSFALIGAGCASYTAQHVEQQPISAYSNKVVQNKIVLAVDPIDTADKIQQIYTVNTADKGFIPIEIVLQNKSNENLLIQTTNITLTDSAGNIKSPVKSDIVADNFEHNKMAEAFFGFGIFSYQAAEDANKKMRLDWSDKSFPENRTLLANTEVRGFLFFKADKSTLPGATLTLRALNLKTNDLVVLSTQMQSSSVR